MATADAPKKVVYFDYNYEPYFKPDRIFLTANSGPYLKNLKWKGWGTSKAVARGRFISDCASCFKEKRAVTVYFRKLVTCKYAPNYRMYRYGKFHIRDRTEKRVTKWNGNCPSKGWQKYN